MTILETAFLLIVGHCLADTALQPTAMAIGKNRNRPIDPERVPPGQKPLNLWWMWLTHHSFIHGGVVFLITGSVFFGLYETYTHWMIDFFKCENKYSPLGDQLLHLVVKLIILTMVIGAK
jgi:hypothetical protein